MCSGIRVICFVKGSSLRIYTSPISKATSQNPNASSIMPSKTQKRALNEVDANVGAAPRPKLKKPRSGGAVWVTLFDYDRMMTVSDLKEQCKTRNLPVGGYKPELVNRLQQSDLDG